MTEKCHWWEGNNSRCYFQLRSLWPEHQNQLMLTAFFYKRVTWGLNTQNFAGFRPSFAFRTALNWQLLTRQHHTDAADLSAAHTWWQISRSTTSQRSSFWNTQSCHFQRHSYHLTSPFWCLVLTWADLLYHVYMLQYMELLQGDWLIGYLH